MSSHASLALGILLLPSACSPTPTAALVEGPGARVIPPGFCTPGVAAHRGTLGYATVQDAIDVAAAWETIYICPGTHYENLTVWHSHPLTLRGATGRPTDVVLDGQQLTIVVRGGAGFGSDEFLRLQDLTLQHGGVDGSSNGPGIHFDGRNIPNSRLEIVNCRIIDHVGLPDGEGVVKVVANSVLITDTVVARTTTGHGAPIKVTLSDDSPRVEIRRSLVEDNEVYGHGSGVEIGFYSDMTATATALLDGVTIRRNYAHASGAALDIGGRALSTNDVRVGIRNTLIYENDNGIGLGTVILGASQFDTFDVRIVDTHIYDNVGIGAAAMYIPGGPGWGDNVLTMTRSSVIRNYGSDPLDGDAAVISQHGGWLMNFNDVDLGAGADANAPFDFTSCSSDPGPHTTGTVEWDIGDRCP
jgi:hypothetical protein